MSEHEHPERTRSGRTASVDDIRQLAGAATPHFALQLRNRISKMIEGLPPGDPARAEGERAIARLEVLGREGETRGRPAAPDRKPLRSVGGG